MSNEDIQLDIRLTDPPIKLNLAFSFTFKSSSEGSYLNQNISTLMVFQFPLFTWKQLMYVDRRCSSFSRHLSRKRIPLLPLFLLAWECLSNLFLLTPFVPTALYERKTKMSLQFWWHATLLSFTLLSTFVFASSALTPSSFFITSKSGSRNSKHMLNTFCWFFSKNQQKNW